MTPQAQRIAIAEACGTLKYSYALPYKTLHCDVPKYDNLDDMNDVEDSLEPDQFPDYLRHLEQLTQSEHCYEVENRFHLVHASAAQRAEAFLRTLGKWE